MSEIIKKTAIRHAEARRTSTCQFADRIAALSVSHYKRYIPLSFQEKQKQTCLACIVAYDGDENLLVLLSMGVGTKFLSESILQTEQQNKCYGKRIRDCHAEVLATRAFRRYLLNEIQQHIQAPCGNAVIKKFCTMKKEVYNENLNESEWPLDVHEEMIGHSIPLGQFALLVKKDNSCCNNDSDCTVKEVPHYKRLQQQITKKQKTWPIYCQTNWCPSGTTTVWSGRGSIHTCSDKIARWNLLGLQGSLLSSLLQQPIYMNTITIGRKFSNVTCRRAICCRMRNHYNNNQKSKVDDNDENTIRETSSMFRLNHPTLMGTSVYMDETGVIEMSTNTLLEGQDVRFHSTESWVSWLDHDNNEQNDNKSYTIECIDGSSGFLAEASNYSGTSTGSEEPSRVSTALLVESFLELFENENLLSATKTNFSFPFTLSDLRRLKINYSVDYETAKNKFIGKSPVLRDWVRRSNM